MNDTINIFTARANEPIKAGQLILIGKISADEPLTVSVANPIDGKSDGVALGAADTGGYLKIGVDNWTACRILSITYGLPPIGKATSENTLVIDMSKFYEE